MKHTASKRFWQCLDALLENSMSELPFEVRVSRMSERDFDFEGYTIEHIQSRYFLDVLPFKRGGRFRIHNGILNGEVR